MSQHITQGLQKCALFLERRDDILCLSNFLYNNDDTVHDYVFKYAIILIILYMSLCFTALFNLVHLKKERRTAKREDWWLSRLNERRKIDIYGGLCWRLHSVPLYRQGAKWRRRRRNCTLLCVTFTKLNDDHYTYIKHNFLNNQLSQWNATN